MRTILIGITGGIAAYKSADLVRLFIRQGDQVRVIMTPAAERFVAPLTFQTLTGHPVYTDLFSNQSDYRVKHIELLDGVSAYVIAPATANTIGKLSGGIADNLLTTVLLAARCPIIIAPSMNENMYENVVCKENIARLQTIGYHVIEPGSGELACGTYGQGRMPDPIDIFSFTNDLLMKKDFHGIRALVTAGPTREPFDSVRFISNPSSGLMGYEIARALLQRGAAVKLVSGPTHLSAPAGAELFMVKTAADMEKVVWEHYPEAQLVLKAAAVSDFRPRESEAGKIKKENIALTVQLEKTVDILKCLGEKKQHQILVGFAAESEELVKNARHKMKKKNLDIIVVNDITEPDSGFAVKTNRVKIIDSKGIVDDLPLLGKEQVAHRLLDRVINIMPSRVSPG